MAEAKPTHKAMAEANAKGFDVDPEYYTAWERTFITDMAGWFKLSSWKPTKAQAENIERIYEKTKRR